MTVYPKKKVRLRQVSFCVPSLKIVGKVRRDEDVHARLSVMAKVGHLEEYQWQ